MTNQVCDSFTKGEIWGSWEVSTKTAFFQIIFLELENKLSPGTNNT